MPKNRLSPEKVDPKMDDTLGRWDEGGSAARHAAT